MNLLAWSLSAVCLAPQAGPLPYDRTNPVWYDNDWTNDYIDWYLMAVASAGEIRYRGITTSSSIAPYNVHMPSTDLDKWIQNRTLIVQRGRASGFWNVPDPVAGARGHLVKPSSGRVEDTQPIDSVGTRALLAEARRATAAKPLVVCMGGTMTVAASAYLMDPTIADKMVVCVVDLSTGLTGYNGWADGWAGYVCLQRLRLVVFPYSPSTFIPRISRTWIQANLPDSPAKTHMLSLTLDVVNGDDGDADGMPAVSILRTDYVQAVKRVSFGGWVVRDGHEMPRFKDDPAGRALVVTQASGTIATAEYQRAFKNPAAWHLGTVPAAPGALAATAVSSSRIDLRWTDASGNETGFEIDRATSTAGPWTQIATVGANVTSYASTGLAPSTLYAYRVRATNGSGDSPSSNIATATTLAATTPAPAAPSGLIATAVSSSRIDLRWTDTSGNEAGFEIDRAASTSGPWTQIATVGANVTSYANTGLAASTFYAYRVRATNGTGDSPNSNVATATTLAGTTTPPALRLHWAFDEGGGTSTADLSGLFNRGTLRNGARWLSGAVQLDGVDDVVEAPDASSLDLSGAVTVVAWLRYEGKTQGWQRIAVKDWGSAQAPWLAYGLTLDDGPAGGQKAVFNAGGVSVKATVVMPANQWVHLAGVHDPSAGRIRIYVNGALNAEAAATAVAVPNSAGPFLVGRSSWAQHALKGSVSDVRVYAEARTASQIAALVSAGSAREADGIASEGANGDAGLNDRLCGALGAETLLLLLAFRRRRRA